MPGAVSKVAMLAAGVTAAGAACVGYGILVERDWYRLRRERVEALGPGQAPLTVLHLSDLHMTAADTRRIGIPTGPPPATSLPRGMPSGPSHVPSQVAL